MKLLDLFCGAGGAARGYELAGFSEIIGVDIIRQDRYLYKFEQYDALEYLQEEDLRSFDLIHASPPCQGYSWSASQWGKNYPKLIERLREILKDKMCDYVIENVKGSPLIHPIILEGNMFNLNIVRRRLFECNWYCEQPEKIRYYKKANKKELVTLVGHGCDGSNSYYDWANAINVWWMKKEELAQAIPPKYTEYIGKQFLIQYKKD